MEREKELEELNESLKIIRKTEEFVVRQEKIENQKQCLLNKKEEMIKELTAFSGVLMLITLIGSIIYLISIGKGFGGVVLGTVIIMIAIGAIDVLIIEPFALLVVREKRTIVAEAFYRENVAPIEEAENRLLEELQRYTESEEFEFAKIVIPEDYFDSESVSFMIKMFNDRRADSVKEAINLYEDYLHKERMENMQNQQLQQTEELRKEINEQSRQQSEYMKEIAKNTKATARAAKVNAIITIAYGHSTNKKMKQIRNKM